MIVKIRSISGFYFKVAMTFLVVLISGCSTPEIIKMGDYDESVSEEVVTIQGKETSFYLVFGSCGTSAQAVAVDGIPVPHFAVEKRKLDMPYNPSFHYSLEVVPGKHELIIALQGCKYIGSTGGCSLSRIGRCNVILEPAHNYLILGVGCSPDKGVKIIDIDNEEVKAVCTDLRETSSPYIHHELMKLLNI